MSIDIDSMPGKLDALATRVGRLETAMVENTEITRVAAIWAAWHQVK